MRKMMMLAGTIVLLSLLATSPAFAQTNDDVCDNPFRELPLDGRTACVKPGACPGNAPARAEEFGQGNDRVCAFFIGEDRFDRDFFDRDFFDRDVFDVEQPFITQDIEQEAESGDIDQSFDVSQTGDNSNQTVGIQGTANTGNAQNVTNVVDAGNFGDFNNNDGFVICDFDRDGRDDGECEDFNHNNDGFVFCDRDRDGKDDGDDDCFVVFPDRNDGGFFDDGFFVNDNNDGDIEIEDSGASITMSPTNTTTSHQEVNQAAAASAPHWVWTASGWMWM